MISSGEACVELGGGVFYGVSRMEPSRAGDSRLLGARMPQRVGSKRRTIIEQRYVV